jgi:hypothetical protein
MKNSVEKLEHMQHRRTVQDRVARLRARLDSIPGQAAIVAVLKGVLDLLADEL